MEELGGLLGRAAYFSAAFTAAFMAASLWSARRLRRARDAAAPLSAAPFRPPITILKPIKGTDPDMYRNLASFLDQDYPRYQVLFCVQDPQDPALPILERLRQDFGRVELDIVISTHRIGYNPKVNNLSNAYRFAQHEFLVLSDSDVRVGRTFLREAAAAFADPELGLATCFYRATGAAGATTALEALSVNAQFLPQALTAALVGRMRFAMGAAMVVRRAAFEAAGGLPALSHHLADDYLLGQAVAAAGYRVELSPLLVDSIPDRGTLRQQFAHMVRWSRTIRVCHPAGFAGTIVLHGAVLLALHAAFGGGWRALGWAAALELWRAAALAWMHVAYLDNREILAQLPWLPASDLAQFAAWFAGLRSGTVLWRGESYSVTTGGRLVPRRRKAQALAAASLG
ncbi:MAG: bacteriohopanetetrol glucosamine biosynthesis glycosyltransferase HpnI [Elusimicrobia bacterium]|nr:bacteriohopanetetrol glucosamine biosynthesis glycosyltransferase HpnI [Elusimicrobiota bacterium]